MLLIDLHILFVQNRRILTTVRKKCDILSLYSDAPKTDSGESLTNDQKEEDVTPDVKKEFLSNLFGDFL